MDFAKRMLEKYGWSQGQGLGKHGTGMTEALKTKRKLNQFGLGHDTSGKMSEEFTYRWWEDAYNEASRNVIVGKAEDGLKMEIVDQDAVQISAVKRSKIKRDKAKYGSFLKRETLAENCVTSEPVLETELQESCVALPPTLSDEQLFQACGGLTAHKGARHGLTLSGKLKRVREQEEALLKALQQNQTKKPTCKELKLESVMLEREPSKKSKSEKKKKSEIQAVCEDLAETCGNETTEKEKKKKRKLENQNVEEGKLSNGEEYEQKESKKSKKKRRHETSETSHEDSAVTSVNVSEDTASEKKRRKKKKDKNGCKDDVHEVQELCQLAHLEKKNKKKRRKTEEADS